jgi:NAD(P)-dependent dehydrogenase (short-subunit alcohol dehydrogenase family)
MNIIVSGASQGIGYELCLQFARAKHSVLAVARNYEALKSLKEQEPGIKILAIDLSADNLKEILGEAISSWKQVDVLVNNAGQLINRSFIESGPADFAEQYKSNVLTAVNLIQASYSFLRRGSHVVNISSMGGFLGSSKFNGLSAYSASKGALSILSECLAEEFLEEGIIVNALALGAVQTEMLEKAFPDYQAPLSAEEMASFIKDFALEKSKFFNGKVLPVALGNP